MTPVALIALSCLAAEPAPLVSADVHRALRGHPVATAPARPEVSSAIRAVVVLRRGRR